MSQYRPRYILPLIVLAQFLGTISWLAGNAVLPELQQQWHLEKNAIASLTNSVQLGFIFGALLFATLALADKIPARVLFFCCALGSSLCSLIIASWASSLDQLLWLRFLSGVMLAGIYPIGMKIATGWYPQGLGRALGFLVGALVLGTASPHLLSGLIQGHWQWVMNSVGIAALLSGFIILLGVPDGPHLHKGAALRWSALVIALRHPPLRAAAGGYFGHMWELYAVWAFAPLWLASWSQNHQTTMNIPLLTAAIISIGALGCIMGGHGSLRLGSRRVARIMLIISSACCLLSPLMMEASFTWVMIYWLIWGFAVVGDSPQLSTLSAQQAPPAVVGSALTLINCIGYSITLLAVELLAGLLPYISIDWLMPILAIGPLLGIYSLSRQCLARP